MITKKNINDSLGDFLAELSQNNLDPMAEARKISEEIKEINRFLQGRCIGGAFEWEFKPTINTDSMTLKWRYYNDKNWGLGLQYKRHVPANEKPSSDTDINGYVDRRIDDVNLEQKVMIVPYLKEFSRKLLEHQAKRLSVVDSTNLLS
jgi:hypothetical protein